jgi:hypothetical protein
MQEVSGSIPLTSTNFFRQFNSQRLAREGTGYLPRRSAPYARPRSSSQLENPPLPLAASGNQISFFKMLVDGCIDQFAIATHTAQFQESE